MRGAIVLLTRGYPHVEWYEKLIKRNAYIYENFNKNLETQYPLVIFHEGNISQEHQNFILQYERNADVRFIDISSHFRWPASIPLSSVKDHAFHPGYRLMCAFNCFHIWNYVKDFDYIMRVDEDCLIGELKYDIFKHMEENSMHYLVSRFSEETHPLTNETLPPVAHSLLGDKWAVSDYDQHNLWVPYTNLYVAKTALFLQPDVQEFLLKLTSDERFLTHRWGDHVTMGIILKAFSKPEKVSHIHNFIFYHGSHHCITQDGRAIEGLLSPREAEVFDCVETGKEPNHYIARERLAK